MSNQNISEVLELSLGRLGLEPQDATEIRKWITTPFLGQCFVSYDFDFDQDQVAPPQMNHILARFLEFESVPLSGVRAFVSNWASAIAADAAAAGEAQQVPLAEFARTVFGLVFRGGLVHGQPVRSLLWLACSLAALAGKRRYHVPRSMELGSERHYVDNLLGALASTSTADNRLGGEPSPATAPEVATSQRGVAGAHGPPSINVFKLPVEYSEFEGPTASVPYVAFKGSVETAIAFYGIGSDRDAMLYIFRHLGKGMRSEIITNLGTSQPTPSAVWTYLDERFSKTDTSESASERWEGLRQRHGERVDDFYARVKSEWLLFARVSGVSLPLQIVCVKFIGGLLPEVKEPLESSCGHQLSRLSLEEARDAALYHESKLATNKPDVSHGGRRANFGKRPTGVSVPSVAPRDDKEITKDGRAAKEEATSGTGETPRRVKCSYCASRKYRGANKHDDANCWKNPANAHLVPDWYRQRQAGGSSGRAPREPENDRSAGQARAGPSTFMVWNSRERSGLRAVPASTTSATGRTVSLRLLVDSGSDLSLLSSEEASRMGLRFEPCAGLRKLESAGSFGAITITGKATIHVTVEDVNKKQQSFNLTVNVVQGLNSRLRDGTILLGMETLRRMRATLRMDKETLYCGVLRSHWPLAPYEAGEVNAVVVGDTRIKLPSKADIDRRLKGWTFPKVTVQLKAGAVRPCPRRPYMCRKREMQATEYLVDKLEQEGKVVLLTREEVESREVWVAPAFVVPKSASKDEGSESLTPKNVDRLFRLVVDERSINESVQDLLPNWGTYMRSVDECLSEIPSGDIWYAGVDVGQAFFNLQYDEACVHLFGFSYYDGEGRVRYALFRYMTMGFKLSSFYWAYSLHSLLTTAIPEAYRTDGSTRVLAFVDDILVWSRFIDECFSLKQLVVYLLERVDAKVPVAKRKGPSREIDYLGLTLGQGGYRVSDATVQTLKENLASPPETLRGLRMKLGLLQFCRSLWRPDANRADRTLAHLTAPFTSLVGSMVASKAKKNARLAWTSALKASWDTIIKRMGSGFVPYHSETDNWEGMQLVVMSDASPEAGAACLWRLRRDTFTASLDELSADWLSDHAILIGVWTHKWTSYERSYDIADRELYAVCHALSHWRQLILSFTNFYKASPNNEESGVGRVTVFMDSTSALGKIDGRLDSSSYRPTTRQVKRWLGWVSDLMEFDERDVTYRHVKGKDNSFSDLLSRLIQGGKSYLPEGGGDAFVLQTSLSHDASSVTVNEVVPSLLQGELRSKLISLQQLDSSTLLHSESLKAWHDHFRANVKVSRLAIEAKDLGLVTLEGGLLQTISDVNTDGAVWVPVIPVGQLKGLDELLNTNVHVNWKVRDWLLFVTHDLDYHRSPRDMRDALLSLVWWPTILKEANSWVDKCDYCMEQKPAKRAKLTTAPRIPRGLVDLDARGKHVAIDHGYPSPSWIHSADPSMKAFLVITDIATGFTVLRATPDVKGTTTATTLFEAWVGLFGVPLSVTGDNFIDAPALRCSLSSCGVRVLTVPAMLAQHTPPLLMVAPKLA